MACGCCGAAATGAGGAGGAPRCARPAPRRCRAARTSRSAGRKVVTRAAPSGPAQFGGQIHLADEVGRWNDRCVRDNLCRHAPFVLACPLPAVNRAPAGIHLIMTVMPGAGASTLTPSSSGSLMCPLLSWTISVGAGLRTDAGNRDDSTVPMSARPTLRCLQQDLAMSDKPRQKSARPQRPRSPQPRICGTVVVPRNDGTSTTPVRTALFGPCDRLGKEIRLLLTSRVQASDGKCATFSSGVRGADETSYPSRAPPSQHPLGRLVRQPERCTVNGSSGPRSLLRVTHSNSPFYRRLSGSCTLQASWILAPYLEIR